MIKSIDLSFLSGRPLCETHMEKPVCTTGCTSIFSLSSFFTVTQRSLLPEVIQFQTKNSVFVHLYLEYSLKMDRHLKAFHSPLLLNVGSPMDIKGRLGVGHTASQQMRMLQQRHGRVLCENHSGGSCLWSGAARTIVNGKNGLNKSQALTIA